MYGDPDDQGYRPPPPFAPPAYRVPPLNEGAVLGATSYGPQSAPVPDIAPFPAYRYGRPRRRPALLIAVSVIAALIAIVAALVSGGHPRHVRSLALPSSVDDYTRVTTLTGPRVRSLFTAAPAAFAGIASDDLAHAIVGVYQDDADLHPSMLFIGFTAHDSPSLGAQLRHSSADTIAARVLGGAGATSTVLSVDAGPLGGALRCATVDLDGAEGGVGVWADRDTLGIVLLVDPALIGAVPPTGRTATVTREVRAAAEH